MALVFATGFLIGATNAQFYLEFDLEADDFDFGEDDERNEETKCTICAWQFSWNKVCKNGMENHDQDLNASGTIELGADWDENLDTFVETDCNDGMWIDRFEIYDTCNRDDFYCGKGGDHSDDKFWG